MKLQNVGIMVLKITKIINNSQSKKVVEIQFQFLHQKIKVRLRNLYNFWINKLMKTKIQQIGMMRNLKHQQKLIYLIKLFVLNVQQTQNLKVAHIIIQNINYDIYQLTILLVFFQLEIFRKYKNPNKLNSNLKIKIQFLFSGKCKK
ncbi:unnamed protein product [Paramecium sonneborni]|uniref:Uncharacterized protein n=1 Tax=Paramecium sonneborni TaxID=65129 RepID=A0A8S1PKM8_9CILI|nr:unnamed protein product [Paramecium sonneborni]